MVRVNSNGQRRGGGVLPGEASFAASNFKDALVFKIRKLLKNFAFFVLGVFLCFHDVSMVYATAQRHVQIGTITNMIPKMIQGVFFLFGGVVLPVNKAGVMPVSMACATALSSLITALNCSGENPDAGRS